MDRQFIGLGALLALLGVALGAFGAHGLKGRVEDDLLAIYEVGVRYQIYHALALVLVGALFSRLQAPTPLASAGWLFCAGIVLFSGSLYGIVFSGIRALGAITPLGGVAFLAGWAAVAYAAFRTP